MNEPQSAGLILILESGLPPTRRNRVRSRLEELGVTVTVVSGSDRDYLEITGDHLPVQTLSPASWDGVERVVALAPEYPHAAWGRSPGAGESATPTIVRLGSKDTQEAAVGGDHFSVMAGPCAIESAEQTVRIAKKVREAGATALRAGAYKPRTSPYAFQGLQQTGLEILLEVRGELGLPVVTEVMDTADIAKVAEAADALQVGSRNMQNYALLRELSQIRKPVLLKRGFSATIRELLLAAEYILAGGNDQVMLCERGIRSAAGEHGVILDLGAIPSLRQRTHLPIVVDPSHGANDAARVLPLARAAVAAGADGLIVEVHDNPNLALSDGQQALLPDAFTQLMGEVTAIRSVS